MTMVMLPWVAQTAETSTTQGGKDNYHWSFSVASLGAQCSVDPYNTDAGDGLETDCSTPVTTNAETSAYFPLLDDNSQILPDRELCLSQHVGGGAGYGVWQRLRTFMTWITRSKSGAARTWMCIRSLRVMTKCAIRLLPRAAALKGWDPEAIRFGPVTCCWWFYWNGANNNDKAAHARHRLRCRGG